MSINFNIEVMAGKAAKKRHQIRQALANHKRAPCTLDARVYNALRHVKTSQGHRR